MTDIEEKSLKAQIALLKGINDADRMILHAVHSTASRVLEDIIKTKIYTKEGQTTVEFSVEEFNKILLAFTHLSSEEGFSQMNTWIKEQCIEPKKEKEKILSMLM